MPDRQAWVLFLVLAVLFLVLNSGAHNSYFQDDDLQTMGWVTFVRSTEFLQYLVSPRFSPSNFRPLAHYYYHVMTLFFPLDFPKFIMPLQVIFLLNVWLLWMVARKLDLGAMPIFIGVVFYMFHAALLDAYWKPMYVFDLLCTTFCLLSLLLWLHDRWILSFIAFWLAYKSKELATMLPLVLAGYEWLLGRKRWKQLIPFFVVSLSFGVQGILLNPNKDNDYTLRFTVPAFLKTSDFYSRELFFLPWAGFAILPLAFLTRDRRLWLGALAAIFLLAPLLVLPGRLFAVYWCLPLTGVAIMVMTLAMHYKTAMAALLLLWLPWNLIQFHRERTEVLRLANGNRAFVSALVQFARSAPNQRSFVYDGVPEGLHWWGVTGALNCIYRVGGLQVLKSDEPRASDLVETGAAVLLHWDQTTGRLQITPSASSH
jgi:hypothetical protein